jgi:hypothetical protein
MAAAGREAADGGTNVINNEGERFEAEFPAGAARWIALRRGLHRASG